MVWKSNCMIDGEPITYDALILKNFGSIDAILPAAFFIDPRDAFAIGMYFDSKHFPQHIIFGNFQCLRCGLCCKNHDWCQISTDLILKWKKENRFDLLQYVDEVSKEIQASSAYSGCNFCRKVRNKPYFACRVHKDKEHIFDCKVYVCHKSLPVAHLNFDDVEDLIRLIGIKDYYLLIERTWSDDFDYATCEYKTH